MKVLIQLALCSALFLGIATAQRRGGGGGGGGFRGGGGGGGISRGGGGGLVGGGFGGGGFRGGGFGGGFRGGYGYGGLGYRGYGGYGYGFGLGFGLGYGWGSPYYGYGYGYGYPYYGYGYGYDPYDSYYPDVSYSSSYPVYQPSTTVVYPPTQSAPAAPYYSDRSYPAMRGYDQYGQQMGSAGDQSSSPIYLIALKNHNIYAASSYSANGSTLNYVTIDHAEKQVPLSDIDRDMTMRLNRERHVPFQLPSQQ